MYDLIDDIARCLPALRQGEGDLLEDIRSFADHLAAEADLPGVEIDPDEGFVSLRWLEGSHTRSVTATFSGNRRMVVTYSSLDGKDMPARDLNVQDREAVASILDRPLCQAVISGRSHQVTAHATTSSDPLATAPDRRA